MNEILIPILWSLAIVGLVVFGGIALKGDRPSDRE